MSEQFHQTESIDGGYNVIKDEEVREVRPPVRKAPNPHINIILFLTTFFTTTFAGTLMEASPSEPILSQLDKGLPFSLTLLAILLFHEFGHYFMAKKHQVDTTLPYFIPAPLGIGTFGAVIKMRSPLNSKRALFDIGVAGPLAGVIVAIPAIIIGLQFSEIRPVSGLEGGISLGSSLLFSLLARISVGAIPENHDIIVHSMAFAGWIGLLVTMLNLLPVGQLDGGHVAYAVLGREWHRKIASLILPLLLILGILPVLEMMLFVLRYIFLQMGIISGGSGYWWLRSHEWLQWLAGYGWIGWLVWYGILRYLIRTIHPSTMDDHLPLDGRRKVIGWVALIVFIITFTPAPFYIPLSF